MGNLGLIPGLGRCPGEGKATHSSILAWRIHGLHSPWGHKESDTSKQLSLSLFYHLVCFLFVLSVPLSFSFWFNEVPLTSLFFTVFLSTLLYVSVLWFPFGSVLASLNLSWNSPLLSSWCAPFPIYCLFHLSYHFKLLIHQFWFVGLLTDFSVFFFTTGHIFLILRMSGNHCVSDIVNGVLLRLWILSLWKVLSWF